MSLVCLSFVFTTQIEFSECCVWFQWFTQRCCSCISNLVSCSCQAKGRVNCWWMSFVCLLSFCPHGPDWVRWVLCLISMLHSMMLPLCLQCCYLLNEEKWKEWIVDGCLLYVFPLLYSQLRLSWVSVVFDFSASLNDVAPVSPIPFPIDTKGKGKEWFVDECLLCVFFLLSLLLSLSSVSIVFDFSASLNDVVPVSPMLLSVEWREMKRSELLMDVFGVSSFFYLRFSGWVWWVLCLISVPHSMMLLLFLQTCCLSLCR